MKKHKLDLGLVLPSDAAACDACVKRLIDTLRDRPGIVKAHVDVADATKPTLCLHYDPTAVRFEELQSLVESAGADLRARFEHLSVPVIGLRHERQAKLVEGVFAHEPGVLHAAVAFGSRRLYVEFDPKRTSRAALLAVATRAGIAVGPEKQKAAPAATEKQEKEHEHAHGGLFGERTELIFSLGCGALTGIGWGLSKTDVPALVPTLLFVLAYLLGSWFTVQEVFVALRARRFEIDFLMLLAAVGAAVLGEWFEGALLLSLFTFGHALEGYAMDRARKAIEALAELVPETALRIDAAGREEEVPVADLVVGDRLLVKPNTRIPADGFVAAGTSSVNQAPITGESVPVDKQPVADAQAAAGKPEALAAEHRVFAGTINGGSALTVVVTKASADSTLARVVKMVAEAETQKSPTQQFTDRLERVFVPIIIAVVVLLLFAWVAIDEPFAASFYRAMAVLVAASPCALAIATPSAVLSGVARAARGGVLVKGGAHLESLGLVKAIAFDKTGTLTEGKPRLTDVVPVEGTTEAKLIAVAVAVEKQSDHPLASAIVNDGTARLSPGVAIPAATAVEAIVGFGVRATVDSSLVLIGKPGLFTRDGALPGAVESAVSRLQSEGRTVMVVKSGERFLGVLGVMDTPRESAREVVAELHRLGIEQTIMLTGDNQRVADAVAKHVGIRIARGDMLPEQKVAAIAELARSSNRVAMVGDGVNDAPAMANATVGIAMGAGGSDVALETADIALMADDLRSLPFAVGLSRAARNIIRQNLFMSLGMVAFLIPATVFGFARIGVAVALHEGSTLLVVANALRLLAYKDVRRT
ncbi:MAG: heavy metal translocating P-type ATPase [Planctomycetes bacterium]|nr:heavy metal translocating P-type ATPase [Planctomycetota bacterium]